MRVISIHSHKGSAGKTTLTMVLAKAHARAMRRVCAVDLDFLGSGFESLIPCRSPERYLDQYITRLQSDPDLPTLQQLITSHREAGLRRPMDFIFNLGGHAGAANDDDHKLAVQMTGREPGHGAARRALVRLLDALAEDGVDVVILDCHPGLAYLSSSVLAMARSSQHEHYTLFVTTTNRAHCYGLLKELNHLASPEGGELFAPARSVLCVNRAPAGLGHRWQDLVDLVATETVHPGEANAQVASYAEACRAGGRLHYVRIAESAVQQTATSVGGQADIVMPGQGEVAYEGSQMLRRIFAGVR